MKISDKALLNSLFDRFTKYLNDNDSVIRFKYEDNKVKYLFKGDDDHWYNWYDERDLIWVWYNEKDCVKDNNPKDERLRFFIGKRDSFFKCPFSNHYKYKIVNKCINFLLNPVSLKEIAIKMDLMGM